MMLIMGMEDWECCPGLGWVLQSVPECHSPKTLPAAAARAAPAVEGFAPLLSTEPHQLLCRQNSRNLGPVGVRVLLCCLPGLSSRNSRELQMGQPWEGSAPPELPLGMVTLGLCSVLSCLLFEICLKPLHTRSLESLTDV